ncbi:hypothetical protein QTP88_029559 [Uroleucon formosanum]
MRFIDKNECPYFIQPLPLQKINYCIGQRKLDLPRAAKNLRPALPLTHLFNLCITQNKIPDVFKVAIITPIYKKGLTSLISNIRPISVISNVAKIFEKIIKARLVHYLESNNLLFEHQYCFRPDKSTDQAIANVTKMIYSTLEEGKKCATIYLDLAKAFDTVDHVKLLKKMHDIGITGSAHSLFESYLEKRKQRVKINDTISCEQTIICGVPQGTTLSPVLFNIQLNDIKLLNLNSNIICYADDTVLICNGLTWEEVFTNIEADLLSIKIWLKKNNLFLNLDKSAILLHSLSECTLPTLNELKIHEYNEGIWGFLLKDIKAELSRGYKLNLLLLQYKRCFYIMLWSKMSKIVSSSLWIEKSFNASIYSYVKIVCEKYRIRQTIELSELRKTTSMTCAICNDSVIRSPLPISIYAPYCKRDTWIHRECVQDLALNAGYFFKLPLCNNVNKFKSRMLNLGIYIPSRDAF